MKKFLSVILALVLVLSLSVTAFAETETYIDQDTVTITKKYTITTANAADKSPAETFKFTIEKVGVTDAGVDITKDNMPVPEIPENTVSFAALSESSSATFDVTLPTYTGVGIYTYKITEAAGTTAGVTYNNKPLFLKVTVIEQDGLVRVAAVHLETEDGEKIKEVENKYDAGRLSVTKTVTGNLGDKNKFFEVKVTLKGVEGQTYAESFAVSGGSNAANPNTIKLDEETKFLLKDGDTISIANIPEGVTYTVVEADYTESDGYDAADYDFSDEEKVIKAADADTVEITNNKTTEIDMGISLDSMPYVVLLTVAVLGVAVILTKKRIAE